jgi:hypothetical protein
MYLIRGRPGRTRYRTVKRAETTQRYRPAPRVLNNPSVTSALSRLSRSSPKRVQVAYYVFPALPRVGERGGGEEGFITVDTYTVSEKKKKKKTVTFLSPRFILRRNDGGRPKGFCLFISFFSAPCSTVCSCCGSLSTCPCHVNYLCVPAGALPFSFYHTGTENHPYLYLYTKVGTYIVRTTLVERTLVAQIKRRKLSQHHLHCHTFLLTASCPISPSTMCDRRPFLACDHHMYLPTQPSAVPNKIYGLLYLKKKKKLSFSSQV